MTASWSLRAGLRRPSAAELATRSTRAERPTSVWITRQSLSTSASGSRARPRAALAAAGSVGSAPVCDRRARVLRTRACRSSCERGGRVLPAWWLLHGVERAHCRHWRAHRVSRRRSVAGFGDLTQLGDDASGAQIAVRTPSVPASDRRRTSARDVLRGRRSTARRRRSACRCRPRRARAASCRRSAGARPAASTTGSAG